MSKKLRSRVGYLEGRVQNIANRSFHNEMRLDDIRIKIELLEEYLDIEVTKPLPSYQKKENDEQE